MNEVTIKKGRGVRYYQDTPITSIVTMRAIEKEMVERFDNDPIIARTLRIFIGEYLLRTETIEINEED
jgi:hypothetical protein